MKTTSHYLDEVLTKLHLRSDSSLARAWEVPRTRICDYRAGRRSLPDDRIVYIAELLGIDVGEIWTAIAIERAQRTANKTAVRRLSELAKRAGFSAVLLGASALSGAPGSAQAGGNLTITEPGYTLCEGVGVLFKSS